MYCGKYNIKYEIRMENAEWKTCFKDIECFVVKQRQSQTGKQELVVANVVSFTAKV